MLLKALLIFLVAAAAPGLVVLWFVLEHRGSPIAAFLDRHMRAGHAILAVMWALYAVGSADRPVSFVLGLLLSFLAAAAAFLWPRSTTKGA